MVRKKAVNEESKRELRRQLAEATAEFLKKGGEIQQIPSGQSGMDLAKPGQKQIKLGNTKK